MFTILGIAYIDENENAKRRYAWWTKKHKIFRTAFNIWDNQWNQFDINLFPFC